MDIATLLDSALIALGVGYLIANRKAEAEAAHQEVPIPIPVDDRSADRRR
ncbi:hypothetical protein GFS31_19720 [Leptolyngbya sp. BL0902]|nr:hypothetical protein [Leptolyngbya sp. BL0902]QQE65286.1 hypothetical protein GFS31_19720 [Leptolyngbya sp. BL0902]